MIPAPAPPTSAPPAAVAISTAVTVDVWTGGTDDGTYCVVAETFASEAAYQAWIADHTQPPEGPYATCPGTPAAPAPAPDPGAVAVQYWRTVPLPTPRPSIPPGYAITGNPAYLVTGDSVDPPTYAYETPLGELTITATGSYQVNWGDGDPTGFTGPYSFVGEPYPNGRITHTYDYVGTYTVDIVEDWTATWHLGAATGALDGLQTRAAINGFVVKQLQAVVTN